MAFKKIKSLCALVFMFLSLFCAQIVISQDMNQSLSEAKAFCSGLTNTNRAMAKAAGYDLDKFCSSLESVDMAGLSVNEQAEMPQLTPRKTISSLLLGDADQSDADKDKRTELLELSEKYGIELDPNLEFDLGLEFEEDASAEDEELKPFGYDLFANIPTSFVAPPNIPVSSDYLLGPGDELEILFYGKLNQSFTLSINRDGIVDFPELGPLVLAGLSFGEAKEMLKSRVAAQVIGTQVSISMGTLRSMQIFVLGEAYRPGAYTVSSLATISHGLISAGGVTDIASLRNIQLKRAGKTISTLDLYQLLLKGDMSADVRLQSGDVIYIPTVGDLVSIDGQVLRPAIYELKGKTSVQNLIELAGGLGPRAFGQSARIERINSDGFMTVVDVNLSQSNDRRLRIIDGDHLTIDAVSDLKKDIISLQGYIHHPGEFAWRPGMRINDIITSYDQFPPDIDLNYALLVRETKGGSDIKVLNLNLKSLLDRDQNNANVELMARDKLLFFSAYEERAEILEPILEQLTRQAKLGVSPQIVSARGQVRFPGEYPLTPSMKLADMITAAGGLTEGAFQTTTEVSRTDLSSPERATTETISVNLSAESIASFALNALDRALFKTTPDYRDKETIVLTGEVMFPGEYPLNRGETLSSVIERAGGFTEIAHVEAAAFTRESLKSREEKELARLKELLEQQIVAEQIEDSNTEDSKVTAEQQKLREQAIDDLDSTEAVGRLVIPLLEIVSGRAEDVILENGDALHVPKYRQEVSVIGEVQQPTSYFYDKNLNLQDYIDRSGGLLQGADSDSVYLVKASGEVVVPKRKVSGFFRRRLLVEPGDTIVVPLDTDAERLKGVRLLTEVSQIIYQLSLGAAAIRSLK